MTMVLAILLAASVGLNILFSLALGGAIGTLNDWKGKCKVLEAKCQRLMGYYKSPTGRLDIERPPAIQSVHRYHNKRYTNVPLSEQ